MDPRIQKIKEWLGTGSINIFGLPFSGKDTIGLRLAELLGAKLLSSGYILRTAEKEDKELAKTLAAGNLAPTDTFQRVIMPYFYREELQNFPLILSSVGRWSGEEVGIMEAAEASGHKIKAVLLLNISEDEAKNRWEVSHTLGDRGERSDDKEKAVLDTRIAEFNTKTMPVIIAYNNKGLLIQVHATGDRDVVFNTVLDELVKYIDKTTA